VGFETGGVAACPLVVEYSREVQARVAEEFLLLPDGFAVVEMMGDYAVLREQARVCARMYAR
jgi:putative intracellular protease/amidase